MLICASQAYLINKYKIIKGKFFAMKLQQLFQQCLKKNVVPEYAHIKMSSQPPATQSQLRLED
jgi:hypothetical protein